MAKRSRLTAKRVERLLKQPGRYRDNADESGVRGLLLVVVSQTNASWQLRYERNGRERWLGLGPARLISLKEARDRARAARVQLLDGVDPLEAKIAAKRASALAAAKTLSFEQAATQYFDQHEKKWRNTKARAQFLSTLTEYAFPIIGALPVSAIDTGAVLKVLEQKHPDHPKQSIWVAIASTANRVRRRIENVLDWAAVRGYRSGDNPARWKGHLSNVLPAIGAGEIQQHHAALAYTEIGEFMAVLRQREGLGSRALEFTILTAARSGEVRGATWAEIDLSTKTWTVPPGRIKGGREHKVPLSDAALKILKSLPTEKNNPHVFIGPRSGGGLSNMGMPSVLSRMGRDDITVHGFRSCFMDWAHERTAFPKVVIDMALAHTVGDKVEAAYRRGDLIEKRRQLMAQWASYCSAPPAKGEVVVPIREARS